MHAKTKHVLLTHPASLTTAYWKWFAHKNYEFSH